MQNSKSLNFGKNSLIWNNFDKVSYNFSSATLSNGDKSLLSKGLNFVLISFSLEYSEHLVDYELFLRDTLSFETKSWRIRMKILTFINVIKLTPNTVVLIDWLFWFVYTDEVQKLVANSRQFEKLTIASNNPCLNKSHWHS